jgi:L-malate glycosyltransferase
LIMQPSLRQQLGLAARTKVLQQLAPSVEQQNWEWVYQQVLGVPQALGWQVSEIGRRLAVSD